MIEFDRRSMLAGAIGGALLPLAARAFIAPERGFTHGVASGEPRADAMLLWTRFVPSNGSAARVRVEVAEDASFRRIVAHGAGVARAEADHSVKIAVGGLRPGRTHYYRFAAPGGAVSIVGRTRTLPVGRPERFTVAVFSCANLPFGFFNAYAHAAARDDIDLAFHVGDYSYEYARGTYPTLDQAIADRPIFPPGETIHLDQYRARLATYRADPDLAALHARLPTVTIWDDHEIANDAWTGGAQNHQPDEGPWAVRRDAAVRAYREWLPTSNAYYERYAAGDLVTMARIETRLSGRDRQFDLREVIAGAADPAVALAAFKAGEWANPSRQLLGQAQERWLGDTIARSASRGVRWQFLANQVLMGANFTPPEVLGWIPDGALAAARLRFMGAVAAARAGLPGTMDNWGGYPAARARLLGGAQAAGANLVVATGDSHNAWAYELANDGKAAGIEFGATSVSAPGAETFGLSAPPAALAAALVAASPELKWCDMRRRGYLTLTFERDRVTARHHLLDTVRQRSLAIAETKEIVSERGSGRLAL